MQPTDGAFRLEVRDGDVLMYKVVMVLPDGTVDWGAQADRFLLVTSDRWTGPNGCGPWCAPVTDSEARATIEP